MSKRGIQVRMTFQCGDCGAEQEYHLSHAFFEHEGEVYVDEIELVSSVREGRFSAKHTYPDTVLLHCRECKNEQELTL